MADGVCVTVGVLLGVLLGVCVNVGVILAVFDGVIDIAGVDVGVNDGVNEGVGVGVTANCHFIPKFSNFMYFKINQHYQLYTIHLMRF